MAEWLRKRPAVSVALVAVVACLVWVYLPLRLFDDPFSTVLLDRDGRLLGAMIADDDQWRFAPSDSTPARFEACALTFEDRRFYRHPGVDPLALGRAIIQNVKARRVVSGASTITMQVIRLSRFGRPRTISEKLFEMSLALRLDLRRSKKAILALYAAHAPFGGNVVGLEAAAWRYFGRDPHELSWAESATLAVLPNSPALIHPGRNRTALKHKRDALLGRLHERGIIDSLTLTLSHAEPLPARPCPLPRVAPHLLARARSEVGSRAGLARVRTSLSLALQSNANAVIVRHGRHLAGNGVHNAAALILDVPSGQVLAYVGNLAAPDNAGHGNRVDIVTAPRSTGSILKPLLYAGMLDAGELLPTQLVPDVPVRMGGFAPQNYTRTFAGAVPAHRALSRSLNVPAVHMLRSYGVDRFHALLTELGMTTLGHPADHYGLALILGGAEGTLWEITGVYAGLARCVNSHGDESPASVRTFSRPSYLLAERPGTGSRVTVSGSESSSAPLEAPACYLTLQAMLEVARPGAESNWRDFGSSRRVAWKTGTSYGFRDAWAVGVTPHHAIGVWVGNADGEGRPGLTGIDAAAPILFELFGLLPPDAWFDAPEADLEPVAVCSRSGYRAGPACGTVDTVRVPRLSLDALACRYCRQVHCDSTRRWRVHADCERLSAIRTVKWFVLPPAMEWYYRRHHVDYAPLPPYRHDCRAALEGFGADAMALIYPRQGSQVYVPRELDGHRGRLVLEAAHRDPAATIHWHLDEDYLGATTEIHEMPVAPSPGTHAVTLVDQDGERLVGTVRVIAD
ncbi:MAG: penicillin-binding protein 1C [Chitinivibrionales bacterium]|nr:penicillin-binding protein 1C [Chitinivibrionales bacterium]